MVLSSDGHLYTYSGSVWVDNGAAGGAAAITRIAGSSGAAGADITLQYLTANSNNITSTTPTTVMTTTGVGVGFWRFRYTTIIQTAALTTGPGFAVNHTGTTGLFSSISWTVSTGGAAATGVIDGVGAVNAGQMVEGKSERVKNTMSSAFAGVDTINSNCQVCIEGIVEVTVSGDLQLKLASEVNASAVRMMAGSMLELTKF